MDDTNRMVAWSGFGDLPELDPVIAHEATDYGWRGLTANGEIFEVRSSNGHKAAVPSTISVVRNGALVGQRAVTDQYQLNIDDYMGHYNLGIEAFRENRFDAALFNFDMALALAPTAAVRFNRGLVLLSLGRWREGFEPYEARLELMTPPMCQGLKLPRWHGEPIQGKSLLLVHDAGFGDTIMMLRYVPRLMELGIDVRLVMPQALRRLASQVAPVVTTIPPEAVEADYYCPMLSLLHLLDQTIESVPYHGPYLHVYRALVDKWRGYTNSKRRQIGVAWSVGRTVEGDYPRAMPLCELLATLDDDDCDIHSLQIQGSEEADAAGVYSHKFEDFADCAALTSLMDEIVTVDTAAAHLAGAIGHPNVTVLLSAWASWRWLRNPFYPHVKISHSHL